MIPESIDIARVSIAAVLALAAMASLILGAIVGVYARPSQKAQAMIMAFGTGALIQALALHLAQEGAERLIQEEGLSGFLSWVFVAGGFAVGGAVYYMGNKFIDQWGGALRHPAMAKLYLLNRKREESAAILEKLSRVDLVRSLPPEDMEDVLVCVQPTTVAAGSVIFEQGDAADALYFIDSGKVDISVTEAGGTRKELALLGDGDSFGEMALLTGEPRTATVRAATDVSLLRIDREHFFELIDRSPTIRLAIEQLNAQRLTDNVRAFSGTEDVRQWQEVAVASIQRLSRNEEVRLMAKHASVGAPLAIFLGVMLDGIPESIVIGSGFSSFSTYQFTFLAAVFLANVPEAIASSMGMSDAGFSTKKIFWLWGALVGSGVVAAALGNIFLLGAPPTAITLVQAVAGGGILAMVSSVMMPEAYEHGGSEVGLSTIAGFLCAFLFSVI
jgi:CRP-like cAMP-binding protein